MPIEFKDVWDFHTDLRWMVDLPEERAYLAEQIDIATAARLGGVFSALERLEGAPQDAQFDLVRRDLERIRSAEGLSIVLTRADLDGVGRQLIHAEGVYFIETEDDLKLLEWLWEEGVRSVGPMYNDDNPLGGGAMGDPARGLTPLGRAFLMQAWRMGFLVDCAHANHRTKSDMIDLALVTGQEMHYSHGHLDEPLLPVFGERGLPRDMARRLLETGALIGLAPHPGFYETFDRHMEEIEFLAEIAAHQVALGSDFAGINRPAPDGRRLFDEFKGIWGVGGFAERLASAHGEDFARSYCGGALKACLARSLPE